MFILGHMPLILSVLLCCSNVLLVSVQCASESRHSGDNSKSEVFGLRRNRDLSDLDLEFSDTNHGEVTNTDQQVVYINHGGGATSSIRRNLLIPASFSPHVNAYPNSLFDGNFPELSNNEPPPGQDQHSYHQPPPQEHQPPAYHQDYSPPPPPPPPASAPPAAVTIEEDFLRIRDFSRRAGGEENNRANHNDFHSPPAGFQLPQHNQNAPPPPAYYQPQPAAPVPQPLPIPQAWQAPAITTTPSPLPTYPPPPPPIQHQYNPSPSPHNFNHPHNQNGFNQGFGNFWGDQGLGAPQQPGQLPPFLNFFEGPFGGAPPPPPPPQAQSPLFQRRRLTVQNAPVNDINHNSIGLGYPAYNYYKGGEEEAALKWPKIFKFTDGRINLSDFEKDKKLGKVKFNKKEPLFDNIRRDSFLILHGGTYN